MQRMKILSRKVLQGTTEYPGIPLAEADSNQNRQASLAKLLHPNPRYVLMTATLFIVIAKYLTSFIEKGLFWLTAYTMQSCQRQKIMVAQVNWSWEFVVRILHDLAGQEA